METKIINEEILDIQLFTSINILALKNHSKKKDKLEALADVCQVILMTNNTPTIKNQNITKKLKEESEMSSCETMSTFAFSENETEITLMDVSKLKNELM